MQMYSNYSQVHSKQTTGQPRVLSAISDALEEEGPSLAQLSRNLWSNPELAFEEWKAHDAITAFLEQRGFKVERQAVLPTGFVASHTAASSSSSTSARPHVALMAEFDALPDIGHACGHNLIATAAVGAALAVRSAMMAGDVTSGRVSVFGTPAEETGGGKVYFLREGRFRDVDAALMVHPFGGRHNILTASVNSNTTIKVNFTGKATHSGANPWEGVNALDAAVLAYQSLATMRQQFPPHCHASAIITKGGTAVNITPDQTEMIFRLWGTSRQDAHQLEQKWRCCIEAAALATGCSFTEEILNMPYLPMLSNRVLANVFAKNAKQIGIDYHDSTFLRGATDMGNVSFEVPSIHPLFNIGSTSQIHERDFAKDTGSEESQKFVIEQATILAMTVVEVLNNSQLRDQMQKEFEETKDIQL